MLVYFLLCQSLKKVCRQFLQIKWLIVKSFSHGYWIKMRRLYYPVELGWKFSYGCIFKLFNHSCRIKMMRLYYSVDLGWKLYTGCKSMSAASGILLNVKDSLCRYKKIALCFLLYLFSASWGFAQSAITYGTNTLTYNVGTTITAKFPTITGGTPYVYGQVITVAGSGASGRADGTGTAATFSRPSGLVFDAAGNLYISDAGTGLIRKMTPAGVVSTIISSGIWYPNGMSIDASGNIYVADTYGDNIYEINSSGVLSLLSGTSAAGYVDGPVATAQFNFPAATAVDGSGNVYVCDDRNSCIRKITPSGTVSTLAGTNTGGNTNGTGSAARFDHPDGAVVDASGNVYVADKSNNVIRKITPAGVVTTFAGNGQFAIANGTVTTASFAYPYSLAFDPAGNIYVANQYYSVIQKITPAGVVSTLAGSTTAGSADGIGTAASFYFQYSVGITTDAAGNVYVADQGNNKIRKIITQSYTISPSLPAGLAFDPNTGGISGTPTTVTATQNYTITANTSTGYCSTSISLAVNSAVQTFSTTNNTTLASWTGKVSSDWNTAGNWSTSAVPGSSTNVQIGISPFTNQPTVNNNQQIHNLTFGGRNPVTLTVNSGSVLSVSGQVVQNHASDDSTPATTIVGAGTLSAASVQVGDQTTPRLVLTKTTTLTSQIANFNITGNLTINSTTANLLTGGIANNNAKFSLQAGVVNVGTFSQLAITNQIPGSCNNFGTAANTPSSIFSIDITPSQTASLFLTDSTSIAIANKAYGMANFYPAVITYAGTGQAGIKDGTLTTAQFSSPKSMTKDNNSNIFLIDNNGTMIREISATGVVSTIAGGTTTGYVDGVGTAARFNDALGLAIDASGNIYVADVANYVIRKITPVGVVSTFAGSGTYGHADGQGTSAMFKAPSGIAIDPSGNLYVADYDIVREITPGGLVSTFAGNGTLGYVDGPAGSAEFAGTTYITMDQSGNIYTASNNDNRIRKISNGIVSTLAADPYVSMPGFGTFLQFGEITELTADATGNVYLCDNLYNVTDKITPTGLVTMLNFSCGLMFNYQPSQVFAVGYVNGPLFSAQFNRPNGIALDASGNIYVADSGNNVIREIIFSKTN